jgi:hypothetical protein
MSKKPIHEVRMGRIKAAIWENETENGNRYAPWQLAVPLSGGGDL